MSNLMRKWSIAGTLLLADTQRAAPDGVSRKLPARLPCPFVVVERLAVLCCVRVPEIGWS